MNIHNFNKTALAISIITLLSLTGCAEMSSPNMVDINKDISQQPPAASNIPPSIIYQATNGESLREALNKVASRSGITFKINTDISRDIVRKSVSAANWESAISQLLDGYNYATVKKGHNIDSIIIIDRGQLGEMPAIPSSASVQQLITISPKLEALPQKYRDYPAGSVTSIDLPIKAIMDVKDQSDVTLNLPMGKFTVTHDRTNNEFDGSKTWVGFLKNEGPGYHVFMSEGAAGVMGHITTPDGTYNLESNGDSTYLLDTQKLTHTGYEGDMIVAPFAANEVQNAATTTLADLQAAVTKAQAAYDTANTDYTQYQATIKSAAEKATAAQTAYNKAVAAYNTANNAYIAAFNAAQKSPTTANKTALTNATNAANTAKTTYTNAVNAYNTAANAYNAMAATLQTKINALNAASAALNSAKTALANAPKTPTTTTPTPTPTTTTTTTTTTTQTPTTGATDISEIDIMVLYTTAGMTADYAKQRLAYLVTVSNQAYLDSKMKLKLRLVYAEPTSYVENNANSAALADLANDKGVFAGVKAKRTQVGADLVYLFRPLYQKVAGSCGTTYVEFANGGQAYASIGYGTISDGNAKDIAGYYCAINTFVHEIGHSLGLVHDKANSTTLSGAFADSYAYGIQGKFGTIMSYLSPVVLLFSNPDLTTQCAGTPCGYVNSTDQLKAMNYTAPIVSKFLPRLTETPVIK